MEPCAKADEIHEIKLKLESRDSALTEMRVKQVEIAGDVAHVKTRIDNGMSHTIARIDANLTALKPVIEHHADIIKRIEDFGWLISRWLGTSVVLGLLGVIIWAITKGFVPKL
jgi:predicted nucleic acid-binding protein